MKQIVIFGAGRSAGAMIKYLDDCAVRYDWQIKVVDRNEANSSLQLSNRTQLLQFDIFSIHTRDDLIQDADLAISMLPARFHHLIADSCLKFGVSLFTASYETEEMRSKNDEIANKGLLFLNEMGLDPGIDHMSAMKMIDTIKSQGHTIEEFESFTGGLIAPESDNNPWGYKFTWNPRNVVMAGHSGPARFIQQGKHKYIPYNHLFRRTEIIEIDGYGRFEGYANRDSLKYVEKYGLEGIKTIYRGTLRRPGFCKAWNVFVQLGATDDSYIMENSEQMTNREFINSFLYYNPNDSVELKLYRYMHLDQDSEVIEKLKWLDLFEHNQIGLEDATPAQILQHILMQKWKLEPNDKDMIVVWHKLRFKNKATNLDEERTASLVVLGDDETTAMSKTVGLPLAIAAKLYLTNELSVKGAHIPTISDIYVPVLAELENYGITFYEKELSLK